MKITNYLKKYYTNHADSIILFDEIEKAFIGVIESPSESPRACYDYNKCIEALTEQMQQDKNDGGVEEYFRINISNACTSNQEYVPVFVELISNVWWCGHESRVKVRLLDSPQTTIVAFANFRKPVGFLVPITQSAST
tara:strand:- start:944 stop:1357 length:414 start_codon:yes stop_codon:yes gene_type:complete